MKNAVHSGLLWLWRMLYIPDGLRWWLMWVLNNRFLVTVAAVILNDQDEVLIFHHTYRNTFAWALPGGWLKRGETPAAAIAREIYEESCLRVRDLHPIWIDADRSLPRVDLIFVGRLDGGVFRCSPEVSEARFFPADALPPLSPGTEKLIKLALTFGPEIRYTSSL